MGRIIDCQGHALAGAFHGTARLHLNGVSKITLIASLGIKAIAIAANGKLRFAIKENLVANDGMGTTCRFGSATMDGDCS